MYKCSSSVSTLALILSLSLTFGGGAEVETSPQGLPADASNLDFEAPALEPACPLQRLPLTRRWLQDRLIGTSVGPSAKESLSVGEIVGETSGGTNGEVNSAALAGGFQVFWTGSRVDRRDGSPHFGVGIQPEVEVVPTVRGIRGGRDEVLEAGAAWLASQMEHQ